MSLSILEYLFPQNRLLQGRAFNFFLFSFESYTQFHPSVFYHSDNEEMCIQGKSSEGEENFEFSLRPRLPVSPSESSR